MPSLTNRAPHGASHLAKAMVVSIFGLRSSIWASQDLAGAPRPLAYTRSGFGRRTIFHTPA